MKRLNKVVISTILIGVLLTGCSTKTSKTQVVQHAAVRSVTQTTDTTGKDLTSNQKQLAADLAKGDSVIKDNATKIVNIIYNFTPSNLDTQAKLASGFVSTNYNKAFGDYVVKFNKDTTVTLVNLKISSLDITDSVVGFVVAIVDYIKNGVNQSDTLTMTFTYNKGWFLSYFIETHIK